MSIGDPIIATREAGGKKQLYALTTYAAHVYTYTNFNNLIIPHIGIRKTKNYCTKMYIRMLYHISLSLYLPLNFCMVCFVCFGQLFRCHALN